MIFSGNMCFFLWFTVPLVIPWRHRKLSEMELTPASQIGSWAVVGRVDPWVHHPQDLRWLHGGWCFGVWLLPFLWVSKRQQCWMPKQRHPKYDKKQDASGMLLCCCSRYFFGLSSGPYRSMKYGHWMYIHYLITGPRWLDSHSHPPKIEVQCAAARFQCKGSPGVPGIMCRTMCIHNESILCEFDVLYGPTYIYHLHYMTTFWWLMMVIFSSLFFSHEFGQRQRSAKVQHYIMIHHALCDRPRIPISWWEKEQSCSWRVPLERCGLWPWNRKPDTTSIV